MEASAPGSLMLLGEHAVLHGRRALVCAIDQRITVELFQTLEKKLNIFSDLGTYEAPLDDLVDHPDFRFVLDAVKQYPLDPSFAKGCGGHGQGIELKISSDFSSDIGFGSSAAVTVATHAALMKYSGRANSPSEPLHRNDGSLGEFAPPLDEIFKRSLATVHRVQGRGSGADVAASVFGGVVAYRAEPLEIAPMCEEFPLTAVYSGSKMKTADVIRHLEERRAMNPDYFERIFDRMDASVGEVIDDFPSLGRNLVLNQKLMEEMGLCNDALAEIIRLFGEQGIPAKISGSGLGDCAIGLSAIPQLGDFQTYPLNVTTHGVQIH